MENNSISLENIIPEGYIIDVENSDLSKGLIKFKLKEPEEKWEDFGEVEGWYINSMTNINKLNMPEEASKDNRNTYPTKELAEAGLAQIQLLQWRNKVWKENGNWNPDWNNNSYSKWCVLFIKNEIRLDVFFTSSKWLCFPTREIAVQFLKDHKSLIEQAKELL